MYTFKAYTFKREMTLRTFTKVMTNQKLHTVQEFVFS